jgi:hypothetical protein
MALNEKHAPGLKGQLWNGREIIHALTFEPSGLFKALSQATIYLEELGYTVAPMCRQEPIGFMYDYDEVAKWKNLTDKERKQVEGVIIPNPEFREGGATIMFFTPPRY